MFEDILGKREDDSRLTKTGKRISAPTQEGQPIGQINEDEDELALFLDDDDQCCDQCQDDCDCGGPCKPTPEPATQDKDIWSTKGA